MTTLQVRFFILYGFLVIGLTTCIPVPSKTVHVVHHHDSPPGGGGYGGGYGGGRPGYGGGGGGGGMVGSSSMTGNILGGAAMIGLGTAAGTGITEGAKALWNMHKENEEPSTSTPVTPATGAPGTNPNYSPPPPTYNVATAGTPGYPPNGYFVPSTVPNPSGGYFVPSTVPNPSGGYMIPPSSVGYLPTTSGYSGSPPPNLFNPTSLSSSTNLNGASIPNTNYQATSNMMVKDSGSTPIPAQTPQMGGTGGVGAMTTNGQVPGSATSFGGNPISNSGGGNGGGYGGGYVNGNGGGNVGGN